ncbi:hypothetical protein PHYBOEH_000103 [Phytophthora boehmeriae]|uniref:Uncharacterized protein n=1 Tax=Phytophthora boehmeriae TaxID=109152 RepID=A0A8T1X8M4_9STRA|nr:hypothetical protein PHYBOEH_000103 [Phytophthora boehmeriae]
MADDAATATPMPARLRQAAQPVLETTVSSEDDSDSGSTSARAFDMAFLGNLTVDGSGVGHVKVNDSMDWSDILPNDTTVRIVYEGSGSTAEILIVPVNSNGESKSASDSASASTGSDSLSGDINPINRLPTGSNSSDSSSGSGGSYSNTGSTPTTLAFVAAAMGIVAVIVVVAMVGYGRRNRRYWQQREESEASSADDPFIVGSLPQQPSVTQHYQQRPGAAEPVRLLDSAITPDLWAEGRYSANTYGHRTKSFSGTAILSDNHTTPSHHRLTVDMSPFAGNPNARDQRYLDDIDEPGRYRMGTAPVTLYDQDAIEGRSTATSRRPSTRRTSSRQPPRHSSRQSTRESSRSDRRRRVNESRQTTYEV